MYYRSRLFGDGFKSGEKYEALPQTYSVNVLGFSSFKRQKYHSSFSVWEDGTPRTTNRQIVDSLF
ncbi:MAG: PD-(D/E)XK nuclease family transposase [Thermoguttaceae bacterium]|nr:PD-(D/E)XK nuclease family transposase [Thermoguttaceae bacterium]